MQVPKKLSMPKGWGLISIFLSGILYYFSTGINDVGLLAWFAPIPVLLYALYHNWWETYLISFFASLFGAASWLAYIQDHLPVVTVLFWILAIAIVFTINISITRILIKKGFPYLAVFMFPAVVVINEYLQSFVSSATFGSIANSQVDFLPIIQIASITGYLGITFILSLFASAIAVTVYYRQRLFIILYNLVITILVITTSLVFGYHKINMPKNTGSPKINVALISLPETIAEMLDPAQANTVIDRYLAQIKKINSKVDLVVLPEMIITVTEQSLQPTQDTLSKIAHDNNIMLVVGVNYIVQDKKYNQAWTFYPQELGLINIYTNQHLLGSFEGNYVKGNQMSVLQYRDYILGVAICKDMDFINPARNYGKADVGLVIVLAADFKVDRIAHTKPAIMRGVENSYSVVRAAQHGLLTISNNTGAILAEVDTISDPQAKMLVYSVPISEYRSNYDEFGNWIVYFCIILLVCACMIIISKLEEPD